MPGNFSGGSFSGGIGGFSVDAPVEVRRRFAAQAMQKRKRERSKDESARLDHELDDEDVVMILTLATPLIGPH